MAVQSWHHLTMLDSPKVLCHAEFDELLTWPEVSNLSDQAHHLYLRLFHDRTFLEECVGPLSWGELCQVAGTGAARNRSRLEAVVLELCRTTVGLPGRPALIRYDWDRGVICWEALWVMRSLDRDRRIGWWRASTRQLKVGGSTGCLSPVYLIWALEAAAKLGDRWPTWVAHYRRHHSSTGTPPECFQFAQICSHIPSTEPDRIKRFLDTWRARFAWHYGHIEHLRQTRRPGGQRKIVPFIAAPRLPQHRPQAPRDVAPVSLLREFERRVRASSGAISGRQTAMPELSGS